MLITPAEQPPHAWSEVPAGCQRLEKCPAGTWAQVVEIRAEQGVAGSLRAMGLRPQAVVRVCRLGEPCIVEVMTGGGATACGQIGGCCRIGLARALAGAVMVVPITGFGA